MSVILVGLKMCGSVACMWRNSIRKGRVHPELSAVASHEHDRTPDVHWQPRVIAKENETNGKVKEALRINRLEKDSGKQRRMDQHTEDLR